MINDKRREETPSSELMHLAERISDEAAPVKINSSLDNVALASEALWLFAKRTGLDQEGETLETVLTDFLANVLHLCRHTGIITDEENQFSAVLQMAEMHHEFEEDIDR
ncbi:TPA: hypothetical protein N5N51_004646 [Enterobacter hormaechei subsp. xiangfangensis]|nr:hypothetical protein [Enterobacter hormaechei]HCM9429615.1 hypothetical protein [Enterobacter hormaechei subsp. xiangfangensis]